MSPGLKRQLRYWDKDGLGDGLTWEDEWTADEDYIIEYIFFKRKDGVALEKSDVTIRIAGYPWTRPKALAALIGEDKFTALPVDEDLPKDEKFEWAFTNREGTSIDITLHLLLKYKSPK